MENNIGSIMKKINQKTKISLTLFFIILFEENLFYLTDRNMIFVLSVSGLILFVLELCSKSHDNPSFRKEMIFLFFIEIIGIFFALLFYGQNLIIGFYGNHFIFMIGWYFYLYRLLKPNITSKYTDFASKQIIVYGVVILSIVIVQGLLSNQIQFLKLGYSIRNGFVRISGVHIGGIAFSLALSNEIKKHRPINLLMILVFLVYSVFFNQSRFGILITIITLIWAYLHFLSKLKNQNKKKKYILLSVFCIPALIITSIFLWNRIVTGFTELFNGTGTGGVRVDEIAYYWELLKQKHFLGIGMLSYQFESTGIIYNTSGYLYLEDVGMFSIIFKLGIFGFAFLIVFFRKLIFIIKKSSDSWQRNLAIILLISTGVGFLGTQIFDSKYNLIYYCLMLVMIQPASKLKKSSAISSSKILMENEKSVILSRRLSRSF